MDGRPPRAHLGETTLGAFDTRTRHLLVPMLMYKSVFMGEWFAALVRHERDASVQAALEHVSRDTLRETLEVLDVMRAWEAARVPREAEEDLIHHLNRRLLHDLMSVKEGNNEVLVMAAMRAPTQALRARLLELAERDREHADELRVLLGVDALTTSLRGVNASAGGIHGARGDDDDDDTIAGRASVGAAAGRAEGETLGATIAATIDELRDAGEAPARILLSHVALRHLRDEGAISPDGTAFELPVDVDLGWRGECFAVVTEDRARLSEILSMSESGGGS